MRHDYDFPADWEAMTDEERNEWFHRERAKRQARNQSTNWSHKAKQTEERHNRRVKARNETTEIKR